MTRSAEVFPPHANLPPPSLSAGAHLRVQGRDDDLFPAAVCDAATIRRRSGGAGVCACVCVCVSVCVCVLGGSHAHKLRPVEERVGRRPAGCRCHPPPRLLRAARCLHVRAANSDCVRLSRFHLGLQQLWAPRSAPLRTRTGRRSLLSGIKGGAVSAQGGSRLAPPDGGRPAPPRPALRAHTHTHTRTLTHTHTHTHTHARGREGHLWLEFAGANGLKGQFPQSFPV